jgi:hypothetical protein
MYATLRVARASLTVQPLRGGSGLIRRAPFGRPGGRTRDKGNDGG